MKKNICKIFLIMTAIAFGLAGCSAEAKVERQLELGASSMEAGDYDAAIEAYEEVISLDKYEIEGYEGLVAAMIADGRSSEEIEGVVASATDIITELKESEGGLSEEDKAAAERLYINAANAVADDKDAQVAILENGAGVLEESSAIKEAYKEAADENTNETTEDAQDSTETTAEDNADENAGDVHSVDMDFGTIAYLGDNKEYPDILEDLEIKFQGKTIQMSLPKDMCARFKWDLKKNELYIMNEDGSKVLYLQIAQNYAEKDTSDIVGTSEMINNTLYGAWGIQIVENDELLFNEENKTQRYEIDAIESNYSGRVVYYRFPDLNPTEQTQSDGTIKTIYHPEDIVFFYGELNSDAYTKDYVDYIGSSIRIINDEESAIVENQKIKEDLTFYGIPEGVTLPASANLMSDNNGRTTVFIPLDNKEDCIQFINDMNAATPITEKFGYLEGEFSGENLMATYEEFHEGTCMFDYNGNKYHLILDIDYLQNSYLIGINLIK